MSLAFASPAPDESDLHCLRAFRQQALKKFLMRTYGEIRETLHRSVKELTGRSPCDVRLQGPFVQQSILLACDGLLSSDPMYSLRVLVCYLPIMKEEITKSSHVSSETKRDFLNIAELCQSICGESPSTSECCGMDE